MEVLVIIGIFLLVLIVNKGIDMLFGVNIINSLDDACSSGDGGGCDGGGD